MTETFRFGNKIIGTLDGDIFYKSVHYSKHHLHKYNAWAIATSVIDDCESKGCKKIIIKDKESGNRYEIPFEMFIMKSFEINHGYGKQYACSDSYFKLVDTKQLALQ